MKELSIEEKARAYDEAIKRGLDYIRQTPATEMVTRQSILEHIFPELKESEDMIMVKFIKNQLFNIKKTITENYELDTKLTKAIDWLERQGNLMKCLQIANSKIGDLIEENYYLRENLEKQGNNMGMSEATKKKLEDNLNKALEKETPESWNKFLDEQGEQKSTIEMITPEESLGIDSETYSKIVDECVYGEQKPIKEHNACEFCEDRYGCVNPCSMKLIEEQKPIEEYNITGIGSKHATGKLAEKIKEFDEKTKELKSLKQGEQKPFGQRDECLHCQFNYDGECKGFCAMKRSNRKPYKPADKVEPRQEELTEFEKAVKQVMEEAIECGDTRNLKADTDMLLRIARKTSWSEEDERTYKSITYSFAHNYPLTIQQQEFVKYLKNRVQLQQEWSEEDNRMCKAVIDNIQAICEEGYFVGNIDSGELIAWLKFLKDRYTWRPSEEQLQCLYDAIEHYQTNGYPASKLNELYEQMSNIYKL